MSKKENSVWINDPEIKIFREYLQIPSVHPDIDYGPCVEFLKKQATNLNLPMRTFYPGHPKKPIIILTWYGTDQNKSTIFLSSHMDVVPVNEEHWTYPPFSATIDADGRIYARGAQDMKCVGMQYLGAIRTLKKDGVTLKRTIHICFTSDEEIGDLGMNKFVPTNDFKLLNIGFALDEGIAEPTEVLPVFYGERTAWKINFNCNGTSGHGSLLHKNTAGEKLNYLLNKFMELRKSEAKRLDENPHLTLGDVTTVNITKLNGGVQSNVVPPHFTMSVDLRMGADVINRELEINDMINRWCEEAGGNIEITYDAKDRWSSITNIKDDNLFWVAFRKALVNDLGLQIKPLIFPAGTDVSLIREAKIPALGFSPMNNTPVLLHDHNEYLTADTYLKGIQIYKQILINIANV